MLECMSAHSCIFISDPVLLPRSAAQASFARTFKRTLDLQYLQGELISESGTMTGGGGKPRRGKMKLASGAPAAAAAADGKEAAVLENDVRQLQEVRSRCTLMHMCPTADHVLHC